MAAHVGDIGTIIRFSTATDISAMCLLNLKFQMPDGSTTTYTASVYNTYAAQTTTTVSTQLDAAGEWLLQIYVELAAWQGHSDIKSFTVEDRIVV